MKSKFRSIVRRYRRQYITVVFHGIRCGICSACRSDYRFPCLHPSDIRIRRSILSRFFSARYDDCPF